MMGFAALSRSYMFVRSAAFDAHRNSHAAADAQRREAFLCIALLHFVEQGHEDARAGRADRMPERNRAAIDVNPVGIPAELAVDGASLCRDSYAGFDEIEILGRPAGRLQREPSSRLPDGL